MFVEDGGFIIDPRLLKVLSSILIMLVMYVGCYLFVDSFCDFHESVCNFVLDIIKCCGG